MNIDPATLAAGMAEAMGGPLATDSEIERTRDRMNDHLERVRADTLRQLEAIQAENGAAERPCPDLAAHVRDVMAQVGRMSLAELKEIQSEPWFNPLP